MRLLDVFLGSKKAYEYGQHFMMNNKFFILCEANIQLIHLIYLFCIRLLVTFVDLITFETSAYQCMHFHSWWEQYTVFVPVDGTWHLYFIKQKSYVK